MSGSEDPIHPTDALKSLDQVSIVDPRNNHIELADWHAAISEITLVEKTPTEVKQLFENAKNVALYTYFAYRLHQPAELIGYSALEKALKIKFEREKSRINIQRSPSRLIDYMDIALEHKWITNHGYESARPIAEARVRHRKIFELIESSADHGESIPVPEPEEPDILSELESMDIAQSMLHSARHIRNFLAHGDGGLAPSSIGTLRKIAEEINQLFRN